MHCATNKAWGISCLLNEERHEFLGYVTHGETFGFFDAFLPIHCTYPTCLKVPLFKISLINFLF